MLVLADKKKKEVNINQLKEVFSVEALNKTSLKPQSTLREVLKVFG